MLIESQRFTFSVGVVLLLVSTFASAKDGHGKVWYGCHQLKYNSEDADVIKNNQITKVSFEGPLITDNEQYMVLFSTSLGPTFLIIGNVKGSDLKRGIDLKNSSDDLTDVAIESTSSYTVLFDYIKTIDKFKEFGDDFKILVTAMLQMENFEKNTSLKVIIEYMTKIYNTEKILFEIEVFSFSS